MTAGRVRVGVVGAGWWSTAWHLPAIVAHRNATLVAVADLDLQKAERAAAAFGAETAASSHERLLELDVDAVVVATPHDAHFEPARAALALGVDVLVEKPMVLHAGEAAELIRVASQSGARLHVGYTFSYTRHVQHLKAAVAAGDLGSVALATGLFASAMRSLYDGAVQGSLATTPGALFAPNADTYASPEHGGGQALSQLTHAIALLLYVLGADLGEVMSLNETHGFAVDVTNALAFRANDETLVSVASTGMVSDRGIQEYHLFGAAARAHLDTAGGTLAYVNGDVVEAVTPLAESEIYPAAEPVNRLIDCRLGRADVLVPGELGLQVTRVLAALSIPRASSLAPSPT